MIKRLLKVLSIPFGISIYYFLTRLTIPWFNDNMTLYWFFVILAYPFLLCSGIILLFSIIYGIVALIQYIIYGSCHYSDSTLFTSPLKSDKDWIEYKKQYHSFIKSSIKKVNDEYEINKYMPEVEAACHPNFEDLLKDKK